MGAFIEQTLSMRNGHVTPLSLYDTQLKQEAIASQPVASIRREAMPRARCYLIFRKKTLFLHTILQKLAGVLHGQDRPRHSQAKSVSAKALAGYSSFGMSEELVLGALD